MPFSLYIGLDDLVSELTRSAIEARLGTARCRLPSGVMMPDISKFHSKASFARQLIANYV